jgi:hypothetical protein
MSEKMFEKILSEQEKFDSEENHSEVRDEILESEEMILNHILKEANPKEAEDIQESYNEYKKVEQEIYDKKGGEITIDDIKERIPDNLWIKIAHSKFSPDIKDKKFPEFEDIWRKYEEEKNEEELEKAKEKGKIN